MRKIGKRAMTSAERQARYRKNKAAKAKAAAPPAQPARRYQPPHGYAQAKQTLIAEGHEFVRAPEDMGREWGGVFVDGAYISSQAVIDLATRPKAERTAYLAEARQDTKGWACDAVEDLMGRLRVTAADMAAPRELSARVIAHTVRL